MHHAEAYAQHPDRKSGCADAEPSWLEKLNVFVARGAQGDRQEKHLHEQNIDEDPFAGRNGCARANALARLERDVRHKGTENTQEPDLYDIQVGQGTSS